MLKMNGLELLRSLRELRPETAVVILTAYGSVAGALEAMKLGAIDFLETRSIPKSSGCSRPRNLLPQLLPPPRCRSMS